MPTLNDVLRHEPLHPAEADFIRTCCRDNGFRSVLGAIFAEIEFQKEGLELPADVKAFAALDILQGNVNAALDTLDHTPRG
jgi:hypothetical protein